MRIVGIRFKKAGRIYDFDAGPLELAFNDDVIIEVEKGIGLGKVARMPKDSSGESEVAPSRPEGRKLKRVVRKADQVDLERKVFNKEREEEAFKVCAEKVKEYKLPMKLVNVEYLFDSSKAIFYFTSESRVDFRVLVKDMAAHLFTRIEMRQIGVRDEAKLLGGFGPCGRELCCAGFLDEFKPVTVRMAKEQGLALNPLKISGVCGRLMCCLSYEHDGKNTKKRPKKSDTRRGDGQRPDTQRPDTQRGDTQRGDGKQSGGRCCATKAEAGKEAGSGGSCACPSKAMPRRGGDRDRNKKDDRPKDDRGRQGRDRNRSDRSARSKEEAPKKAPLKGDIHLEGVVPDANTESGDKKPQGDGQRTDGRKGGPAGARPGSSGSPGSPGPKKRRGRRRGRRGGAGKKRTEGQGGSSSSSGSSSGSGGGSSSGSGGSSSGGSTPSSGGGNPPSGGNKPSSEGGS